MDFYQKIDGNVYVSTGEIVPIGDPKTWDEMYGEDFEKIPNGGFGIHRVEWYCKLLEAIGGKKGKVVSFLLKNKTPQNLFVGRVQDIAVKANVATQTVTDTIKALRQADIIKTMTCAMMINPGCEHKGNRKREAYLMKAYEMFGQRQFKTLEDTENFFRGLYDALREPDD